MKKLILTLAIGFSSLSAVAANSRLESVELKCRNDDAVVLSAQLQIVNGAATEKIESLSLLGGDEDQIKNGVGQFKSTDFVSVRVNAYVSTTKFSHKIKYDDGVLDETAELGFQTIGGATVAYQTYKSRAIQISSETMLICDRIETPSLSNAK
jgi:hypothetical protein